jgi:hypothetical protein
MSRLQNLVSISLLELLRENKEDDFKKILTECIQLKASVSEDSASTLFDVNGGDETDSYLQVACTNGSLDLVKFLVQECKANVNQIYKGMSAADVIIHSCSSSNCGTGNKNIFIGSREQQDKCIEEAKANRCISSCTSIASLKCNHVEIATFISSHGAKPFKMQRSQVNNPLLVPIFFRTYGQAAIQRIQAGMGSFDDSNIQPRGDVNFTKIVDVQIIQEPGCNSDENIEFFDNE